MMKQAIYSIALIALGVLFGLLIHSQYDVYKAEQAQEEYYREAIELLKEAEGVRCLIGEDLTECRCNTKKPDALLNLPVALCWKHVDKSDIGSNLTIAD